ncbi:hypothetical protein THAOC_20299, partial [Thalassiosira oceanica]
GDEVLRPPTHAQGEAVHQPRATTQYSRRRSISISGALDDSRWTSNDSKAPSGSQTRTSTCSYKPTLLIDSINLRHNLALALLNINELPDPVSGQPRLQFQPPSSHPARRKRKRSKRGAVGSKRPRTNVNKIEDHTSNHDTPLLNRKRAAKSLNTSISLLSMLPTAI